MPTSILNMKLTHVACPICGYTNNYTVLYPNNFSAGDITTSIFSARRMPDKIHYQIVTCKTCGLVRSTPTITAGSLYRLYKNSRFTYGDEVRNLIRTYVKALKPILQTLHYSAKILDIGCGNGFLITALHDLGYTNVYGIEPSSDAIDKAHHAIKKNLIHNTLKPGIFKEQSFDFIFFFQTLDHIPDPNGFLKECYHILKHQGYILSFNHNIDSLSSKLLGERSPIIDIEHTFLYSPKTITLLFRKAGFTVDSVYSPLNSVSVRHIIRLSPVPDTLKKSLLIHKPGILNITVNMRLGNICLVGRKK